MFFFNGRVRNAHVAPIIMRDQPHIDKIGHSYIITSCLSIIIGLVLIFSGVTFETQKTILISCGIITLGIGFVLTTLICFYAQLKLCYDNWAYGSHIATYNSENSQIVIPNTMSISYFTETSKMTKNTVCKPITTSNICKNATVYGNK